MTTEGNLFKGALVSADNNQIVVANEKKQKGKKALIEEVQIENEKIKEIKVIISFM
jgi:ribosome maturation factor RimP